MLRRLISLIIVTVVIEINVPIALTRLSSAQEWAVGRPRGTLKVVDLFYPQGSVMLNYGEGLVTVDKDNKWIPCLAEDWRWIDERTLDFMLRRGVTFHNGEKFNAEAVRINWEAYRRMKYPRVLSCTALDDDTEFSIIDDYTVRFTFPEPEGLAFVKFFLFIQIAPAFFSEHSFAANEWGYLRKAGPWGTGPFKFREGGTQRGKVSDQFVLEAYEKYWDRHYPKVEKIIYDNTLIGNREEAMKRCRETEGAVDIVSNIRSLDTLKIAESRFAQVIKSRDKTVLFGHFNQRKKGSKWNDIRLREAVSHAINRTELWKYAAKGNAYNLEGFFLPPGAFGFDPSLPPTTYDTSRAKSLIAEAGYPNGFEMKVITKGAFELEAKIICSMLERVGLKAKAEIHTPIGLIGKYYIPFLDRPPEEQEWDFLIYFVADWFGHPGASFFTYYLLEGSDMRWIEYDSEYEEMWNDMARAVDPDAQKDKIRGLVQYLYDQTYRVIIYSPLSLYAVNKEVNFVPQEFYWLRLKETSVTDNHWSVRGRKD